MTKETTNRDETLKERLFDQLSDEQFAKPQLDRGSATELDLNQAIGTSLANPIFYPSLTESVFAGDKVAIALQSGLPWAQEVLASLIRQLMAAKIELADIVVVISPQTARQLGIAVHQNPESQPTETIEQLDMDGQSLSFQIHDGENDNAVSYLVANEAGDPVHINRLLFDADVVLPVGCPSAGGVRRQVDCLYPEFASAAVKKRFAHEEGSFIARQEEIELANNSLGSFFSIQVVCGPGDHIKQVICGARKDATDLARSETNKLWEFDSPENVETVVATIETHPLDQTWDDFVQALITASDVSHGDGPIVVWSEISQRPTRRIRKACHSQFEEGISSKLSKELQHVAAIIKERPVYLRSRLSRGDVEDLGVGFIESVDDINRIAEPYKRGLLLRDAQKCQIRRGSLENSA